MNYCFNIPALRGMQNGRVFYQAIAPFSTLAALFKLDDAEDVNERSQRIVNKIRAKKVANYIQDNKDGFYIIPPVIGHVSSECTFTASPITGMENTGTLSIPMAALVKLFDGQHRATGIKELLARADVDANFASQMVSIMLFDNLTLKQRQQAFHDINFTQAKPSAAICMTYNDRSERDQEIVNIMKRSVIGNAIEYEKNAVYGKSDKIYSIKALKAFALKVMSFVEDKGEALAVLENYTNTLFSSINISYLMRSYTVTGSGKDFRTELVLGHNVTLMALAELAHFAITRDIKPELFDKLRNDTFWRRDKWVNFCVSETGKMINNPASIQATATVITRAVRSRA
jgi:DNA sulfur modification protein DndB